MIALPPSPKLPIEALASCFEQVTNSYKFYWFLAILDQVRENQSPLIPFQSLLASMVGLSWYPLIFYRLSFGKQDQLGRAVNLISRVSALDANSSKAQIIAATLRHLKARDDVGRQIARLADFVPYRFLSPFFAQQLRGLPDWEKNRRIRQLAEEAFSSSEPCLYRFVRTPEWGIEIHPDWYDYLQKHLKILTDFCFWNLVNYLHKNNPNVLNIAAKLFIPAQRELSLARKFWNLVLLVLSRKR